jgi:Fe-S cluster biogenesis protein NfuA/nitrite reductase/ring-hydroxylating ferredoxin subunit
MATGEREAFQERLARIETLINEVQATANPALRTGVEELVQTLLELHGVGLERMMDIIWESGSVGERLIHERLPDDKLVSSLLLLHGLHPLSLEDRVQQALAKVRPYLQSHGGNVEVVSIMDGVVRLRLQGSCQSCPASAMTLKYAVEDAIYEVAPDVTAVMAVGNEERPKAASFIPITELALTDTPTSDQAKWHDVDGLTALAERSVERRQVNGRSLLITRLDENLYAYADTCPHCHQLLTSARVEGTTLACPHCGQTYDVIRAGRGLDKPDLHLEPFPLLMEQGRVRIALPM